MHRPRLPHPNYISPQPQWRSHGPGFGPIRHREHRNYDNDWSRVQCNFNTRCEEHWCETCDRGFGTLQQLEKHKEQHQKCNIDGCQFIAHPKVVTKHIQMQHSSGLFKKIAKLNSPEEIGKWREERRKNYPTKENIEKKITQIKEKVNRGEKMDLKGNRGNKPYQSEQGTKRKYKHDNNKRQNYKKKFQASKSCTSEAKTSENFLEASKKPPVPKRDHISKPKLDDSRILKPFAGILNLLDENDSEIITDDVQNTYVIEDDDYNIVEESQEANPTITEPKVCGALTSLICSYESSEDESETHNHETTIGVLIKTDTHSTQNATGKTNECHKHHTKILNDLEINDDGCGPEETKIVKIDNGNITDKSNYNNKQQSYYKSPKIIQRTHKTENNITNSKKFKPKLPSTLLEKLLHNEIRQERNIILQCVHYIVKNNFFDKK